MHIRQLTQWIFHAITVQYVIATKEVSKCRLMFFTDENATPKINCSHTRTVCPPEFNVYTLEFPPYNDRSLLEGLIGKCCGNCSTIADGERKGDLPQLHLGAIKGFSHDMINGFHFVYPFLGSSSAKSLYGFHFIPVVPVPNLIYITKKNNNDAIVKQLWSETLTLFPMIVLCLLMALIAGFIAWILETGFNEEEFPRPFLIGWFEGFWWSFISMTTVGYGDKTPKTIVARFFSVLWILTGIALFNIVSGEITKMIMQANNPEPPHVFGQRVGVPHLREYENSYVALNGGIVKKLRQPDDFRDDIMQLARALMNDDIDGIVMDKRLLAYTVDQLRFYAENATFSAYMKEIRFILNETLRTEKLYEGDKLAYGILVRDTEHYDYLHDAFIDNRLSLVTNKDYQWNNRSETVSPGIVLFDPTATVFKLTVASLCAIIGTMCVFGFFYETKRRGLLAKTCKTLSPEKDRGGESTQTYRVTDAAMLNKSDKRSSAF